jgi:hypothetical protein
MYGPATHPNMPIKKMSGEGQRKIYLTLAPTGRGSIISLF